MSEPVTVARPYARAAYAATQGADDAKRWGQMLAKLSALTEDAVVKRLIGDLRYSAAQVADAVQALLGDDVSHAGRLNFVRLLSANRRLVLAPEIARLFERYAARAERIVRATVISAQPLDDAQQEAIRNALAKRADGRIELDCSTDESLLGGAVVRLGDLVIDGSVKSRLQRFSATLIART